MVAGSDSHFAATVGLGVTEIEAADAEEAVEAIRAGQTRVVGKTDAAAVFHWEYLPVDLPDCEEGCAEKAEGVAGMTALRYKILLILSISRLLNLTLNSYW